MIKTYLLILALVTPDGLVPHRILSPSVTKQECVQLLNDEVVRKSYLDDHWAMRRYSTPAQLMCIEFKPLLRKNHD